MGANRRRPHSAAVPGAGCYLFEDTYGQVSHALPARRGPAEGPASRNPNRGVQRTSPQQQQQRQRHHAPYLPPPTPPAGGGGPRARQGPHPGRKTDPHHLRQAGQPLPPQVQQQQQQPPPADAIAFRFFTERRNSGPQAAAPAVGGLVRPEADRRSIPTTTATPELSQIATSASPAGEPARREGKTRKGQRQTEGRFHASRCIKYPSRPASSPSPSAEPVRLLSPTYPYTTDSDASTSNDDDGGGNARREGGTRGTATDEAVAIHDEEEVLFLDFLSDKRERELCHCMAEFLSAIPPQAVSRVLAAVRQESDAQRLLCRYGGVYPTPDGAAAGDDRAVLMGQLHAKWVAAKAAREQAEEKESRRREWVRASGGGAAVGSGASAALAVKRHAAAGPRERKLLTPRARSPSNRSTSTAGRGQQRSLSSANRATAAEAKRQAAALSSPTMARPPARKGRYAPAASSNGDTDEGIEGAWLLRRQDGADANSSGSDSEDGIPAPLSGPPRPAQRQRSGADPSSGVTTAATVTESPDRSSLAPPGLTSAKGRRRSTPLTMRLDQGVLAEPVVIRADDGTEVTLSPGAAAARAAYVAAHPDRSYHLPAGITGARPLRGSHETREEEEKEEDVEEDDEEEATGVAGDSSSLDAVRYSRSQREAEDRRAAFERAAEDSGMRADHGGYPVTTDPTAPSDTNAGADAPTSSAVRVISSEHAMPPLGMNFSGRPSARSGGSAGDSVLLSTTLADSARLGGEGDAGGHTPKDGTVATAAATGVAVFPPASGDQAVVEWDFTTSTVPPPSAFQVTQRPTHAVMPPEEEGAHTQEEGEGDALGSTSAPAARWCVEHHTDQVDSLILDNGADLAMEDNPHLLLGAGPAEAVQAPAASTGDANSEEDVEEDVEEDFEEEPVEEVIEDSEGEGADDNPHSVGASNSQEGGADAEDDFKLPWED